MFVLRPDHSKDQPSFSSMATGQMVVCGSHIWSSWLISIAWRPIFLVLDRAEAYQQTEMYQKAMRKRSVWVDPLFGEAKQFHRLRKFRLRGSKKVNIEGVLVSAGQNIKRLLKHELNCFFC